jgi:hypothetical protein
MTIRREIEAAVAVLREHGIDIALPWEGDLDDLERERYEALHKALDAARVARETADDEQAKDGNP